MHPKKSLGQHWLFDEASLNAIVTAGEVGSDEVVIEVGPGLGTLTKKLCHKARQVIAIELDDNLAAELPNKVKADNLTVEHEDALKFNFNRLPAGYKVVANIPYYLTSHLLRVLLEAENKPSVITLLVQKEVAERVVASPGNMSILAVSVQFYGEATLRELVPAELFTPPPKVDSQILKIKLRQQPLYPDVDIDQFFQLVKAGFSEKRKKLRSSLSGGLHISKIEVDELLERAGISLEARAQELSLEQWYKLYKVWQ